MPFTTLTFIGFFAALFFAYYVIPKRCQWWLLLLASMVFYAYASPFYLLLLWATILVSYIGTLCIGKAYVKRDEYLKLHKHELTREDKKAYKTTVEKRAKAWLSATIITLLSMLVVFKYAQFAIDNFFALLGLFGITTLNSSTTQPLNIILPVGLSFYLFQTIGYCIDVYREEVSPEGNLFKHALFVSFFPQLLQGPIGNYGRLAPQLLAEHTFDYDQAKFGLQRIAWGFFKKFMIANTIANRIDVVWTHPEGHFGIVCWLVMATLYAVQLYADFSGYMDIACGCSQMLGIKIDENFNCPYFSKTIPEFWRRWHTTLSEWFKSYLFYPILRSDWCSNLRKRLSTPQPLNLSTPQLHKYLSNVIPTIIALSVVWFNTGLWHGASWGYVAWGVYYGMFMIASVALQPLYDNFRAKHPRFVVSRLYAIWQMMRTFAVVVVGYTIFKPDDLVITMQIWKNAIFGDQINGIRTISHSGSCSWGFIGVVVGIIFMVDAWHYCKGKNTLRVLLSRVPMLVRWLVYLLGLWSMIYLGLYGSGFDQFEYFKF